MSRSLAARLAPAVFTLSAMLFTMPAFAHPGAHHASASFAAGFVHPFSGWDHLLALLAVGLWAAQQRGRVSWGLMLVFPLTMMLGALGGLINVQVPVAEIGIAGSVFGIVLLVAFAVRMPTWAAIATVMLIAMLHGYVHGVEAPAGASIVQYVAGFVTASVVLLFSGFGAGSLSNAVRFIHAERLAVLPHRV